MIYWNLEEKRFDLRYNWKISRNESIQKNLFFITVKSDSLSAVGECSPNVRYGETPEKIHKQFKIFSESDPGKIRSLNDLSDLLEKLSLCNSLRFGIESAYVHLLCRQNKQSVDLFLEIPAPRDIYTSYTIPIIPPSEVKEFIDKHNLQRFKSLKIKVNTEGLDLINECAKHYHGPLMIDANEAWTDVEALMLFLDKLKKLPIEFIEQPLPYNKAEEYIYLKKHSPYILIGDESITDKPDFDLLEKQFHGINMKLMKAGGYLNGKRILVEARKRKMKTMVGCMIETTLGISSAMHLCGLTDYADLDGHFVIANEPFGLIKETEGKLEFNQIDE